MDFIDSSHAFSKRDLPFKAIDYKYLQPRPSPTTTQKGLLAAAVVAADACLEHDALEKPQVGFCILGFIGLYAFAGWHTISSLGYKLVAQEFQNHHGYMTIWIMMPC